MHSTFVYNLGFFQIVFWLLQCVSVCVRLSGFSFSLSEVSAISLLQAKYNSSYWILSEPEILVCWLR